MMSIGIGFSRSWDGDTAYVFILRDGANLLGALAVSCQDGSNGARSTAFVHGLLRPALQVLARELAHQQSVGDLRKNLTSRDGDLALLLEASDAVTRRTTTIWSNCSRTVSPAWTVRSARC